MFKGILASLVLMLAGISVASAETAILYNVPICGGTTAGRCTVHVDALEQWSLYWENGGIVNLTIIDVVTGLPTRVYATNLFRDPHLGLNHEVLIDGNGFAIELTGNLTLYRVLIRSGHNYYVTRTKFTDGVLVR